MAPHPEERIEEVVQKSTDWLLSNQHHESGGWSEVQGRTPSPLNTAEAIVALLDSGRVDPGNAAILAAVEFLKAHQEKVGEDLGAWSREVSEEIGKTCRYPEPLRTSVAIRALIKAGAPPSADAPARGLTWLLKLRNSDGGWPLRRGTASGLVPTCFVLEALLAAHRAGGPEYDEVIRGGLSYLVNNHHQSDGSFGRSDDFSMVHTMLVVNVLQQARDASLSTYANLESRAIYRLMENSSLAMKPREEIMEIDAPGSPANFPYLYSADTMLVEVLSRAPSSDQRNSELLSSALIAVRDRVSPNGGAYGLRIFSWSTAKTVSALTIAKSANSVLPSRQPERPSRPDRWIMMGVIVTLIAVTTYLSATGKLTVYGTAIFILLILAALLVWGFIREPTFADIVKSMFKVGQAK